MRHTAQCSVRCACVLHRPTTHVASQRARAQRTLMRSRTRISYAGRTARVITHSRAVPWLRLFNPSVAAFVLGNTIRVVHSVREYLDGASSPVDRATRVRTMSRLLAHEWCHVEQFSRDGWWFLPRWCGQVARGTLRRAHAGVRTRQWWAQPIAMISEGVRLPSHARSAYRDAPYEREADTFAETHAQHFVSIVESLP